MSFGAVHHGSNSAITIRQIPARNYLRHLHQVSVTRTISCGRWPALRAKAAAGVGGAGSSPLPAVARGSFYDLLEISEDDSFEEIKRAYKRLARKYHPDVCPPDRTEEYTRRFIEVQEAYETLFDPRLRDLYDRDLSRGLHLAFSARRRRYDEELEEQSRWRRTWQDQLAVLKRKSMNKDSGGNLSWGARMRRRREESSSQ